MLLRFLVLTLSLPGFFAFSYLTHQDSSPEQEDDKIEIPHRDDNTMARRDFMRTKLMYSQNIFEGLTTGNLEMIKEGAKEVGSITKAEQWVSVDDVRYRKLTDEFETTIKRLSTAVDSGNIEAIEFRFYQMSSSCVDCHQHIRKVEYEY